MRDREPPPWSPTCRRRCLGGGGRRVWSGRRGTTGAVRAGSATCAHTEAAQCEDGHCPTRRHQWSGLHSSSSVPVPRAKPGHDSADSAISASAAVGNPRSRRARPSASLSSSRSSASSCTVGLWPTTRTEGSVAAAASARSRRRRRDRRRTGRVRRRARPGTRARPPPARRSPPRAGPWTTARARGRVRSPEGNGRGTRRRRWLGVDRGR